MSEENDTAAAAAEEEVIPMFDPSVKKKKKKKKTFEESLKENDDVAADVETTAGDAAEDDFGFGAKKKKKKKVGFDPEVVGGEEDGDKEGDTVEDKETEDTNDSAPEQRKENAWEGTDRDYTYDELLGRIVELLHDNNPELARSKHTKLVMKPPVVFREGTKRTVWANFAEISQFMNRNPDHVLAFAFAELGTQGSLDGNKRLVIKGRFNPKQIEKVIRSYIAEYVTCRTCKSPETNLKKENRIYFIQCRKCGSTRSVATIKTGFQAQVGKRRKMK